MSKKTGKFCDNGLQAYFEQIGAIPLLTFEEELELSRCIQNGDKSARRRLIEANLKLVVKIARGFLIPDTSLLDLIQEGNMGLMHAADKYDFNKQVRFSTYAAWWIRQAISRFLANKRRFIRLPHRKEETLRKIQHTYYSLSQILMRQPKTEEIAAEVGIDKEEVEFLMGLAHDLILFDIDRGISDSSGAVEYHEDYTYSPERALIRKNSRELTLQVLNKLKAREKRILIYRYQLYGGKQHTLKNISEKMGLSTETVRQIEMKALRKLRVQADELKPLMEAR